MKCDNCNAPKWIKESVGCCIDRLANAHEQLKHESAKSLRIKYKPKFQCRFADLIESIEEESRQ